MNADRGEPLLLRAARIVVDDLDAARRFYGEVLGLPLRAESSGAWCVFDAGVDLVIERADAGDAEAQALVGRFSGLSFGTVNIAGRVAACRARGAHVIEDPQQQPWGGWLATLADPAGNRIQLVQYPTR